MLRAKIPMTDGFFCTNRVSNPNRHSSGSPAPLQMELLKFRTWGGGAAGSAAAAAVSRRQRGFSGSTCALLMAFLLIDSVIKDGVIQGTKGSMFKD